MVAITDKNLRVGANQRSVKMRQQFSRSPAAAGAEYAVDRRIRKRGMKIIQTIFLRTGVIERPAVERVGTKNSVVTERVQMGDAAMHQVSLRSARR